MTNLKGAFRIRYSDLRTSCETVSMVKHGFMNSINEKYVPITCIVNHNAVILSFLRHAIYIIWHPIPTTSTL